MIVSIRTSVLLVATASVVLVTPGASADVSRGKDAVATARGAKARARLALQRNRARAVPHHPEFRKGTPEWNLVTSLEKAWKTPTLRPGKTAIYVKDARTGEVLYSVHADQKLNPASNVKLLATAAVLDTLGPGWRYATRLYGATPDRHGVVRGSVYLFGNHDPTLNYHHLGDMAATLAANGVTRIEGDVVIGLGARRDGVGWPVVKILVVGADKPGAPPVVTVTPSSDLFQVDTQARTAWVRRSKVSVASGLAKNEAGDEAFHITVNGTIRPRSRRLIRRWVPARALFTAHALRAALENAGIAVAGSVKQQAFDDYVAGANSQRFLPVALARHDSAPMADIVSLVNKRSINYLADGILMTAGAAKLGGAPTMEKGIQVMHDWLSRRARIAPEEVVVDTGSGLSYRTELTAKHIVRVLRVALGYQRNMPKTKAAPATAAAAATGVPASTTGPAKQSKRKAARTVFRKSLAVAGVDGTLRGRYKRSHVRGRMIGKTGTLTGIIALSGVVTGGDDNALAFSIVTNGTPHWKRRRVRYLHDRMVKAMHRYLRARSRTDDEAGAAK